MTRLHHNEIAVFLFFTFYFSLLPFAFPQSATPAPYENKWLIIVGNYESYEKALAANEFEEYNATILQATYFENLNPGWYMLVKGKFDTKAEAQKMSDELMNIKGIDSYVKFTGELFDFEQNRYRLVELDDEDYFKMEGNIYYYIGDGSPDDRRWVLFVDHEEDPEEFPLIRTAQDAQPVSDLFVFADEEDISWSSESDKFTFIDYDAFYNGGDHQLYIVDVFTCEYISILLHELIEGRDFGNRTMLSVYNLGWLPNAGVAFCMDVDFLGTSGDDMIDKHRIEKLGEDFGSSSPVFAGNYIVYLEP